jgi:hypothetical protein
VAVEPHPLVDVALRETHDRLSRLHAPLPQRERSKTMSRSRFGRTMRRLGFPAASTGGVLIACLVAGSALGAGGGSNSTAAAPCLNGGWMKLVHSDGSPFASQAPCVSYANQRDMLLAFTGCFVVDADNLADASTNSLQAVVAAAARPTRSPSRASAPA